MKWILVLLFIFPLNLNAAELLKHFTKAVTNVASNLEEPGRVVQKIVIQNPTSNTASVFVGESNVAVSGATRGLELMPGDSMSMEGSKHNGGTENMNTAQVYIIAPSNQTVVVGVIVRN